MLKDHRERSYAKIVLKLDCQKPQLTGGLHVYYRPIYHLRIRLMIIKNSIKRNIDLARQSILLLCA